MAEVLGFTTDPSPAHLVTALSVGRQCGALSAGLVAISLVWGRSAPAAQEEAERCWALGRLLRDRFEKEFGTVLCEQLYATHQSLYGSCQVCYARGAELAVDVLLEGCNSAAAE